MICGCLTIGNEEEDMTPMLNVVGLKREKTENTNRRKKEIKIYNNLIE